MPLPTDTSADDALYLHVFRVSEGRGNACLMELPDGTCGIVDWGTQREDALDAVLKLVAERRIRFVAASHAHADHTLGLAALLQTCYEQGIPVERFVYPASTLHRATAYLTKARLVAKECGIPMSSVAVDDFPGPESRPDPPYLAWARDPAWEVRLLSPSQTHVGSSEIRALSRDAVPGNETSLVILFRFSGEPTGSGMGQVLLPGDATPATLRFARQTTRHFPTLKLDNQAFVVPHHGSSSNLPHWLDDHLHGIVVVSAPTDSRHHPGAGILERLRRRTCGGGSFRLFCTSYAGACFEAFGELARGDQLRLVRPGRCFGDIAIRVPQSEPAGLARSSASGEARRPFGYCGNVR